MFPVIEVIAHHVPNEPPRPLRIRFKGEDEEYIVHKVEKVTDRKMERLMGNVMYVYRISVIDNNKEKIIGLKYEVTTMLWYLTP